MGHLIEVIKNDRAAERLCSIFLSLVPSLIVGILLIAIYFFLKVCYNKKNPSRIPQLKRAIPWLFLVFAAALWLTHNGVMDERVLEWGLDLSLTSLVFWAGHFSVFAVFGLLLRYSGTERKCCVLTFFVSVITLEALQYFLKLGSGSWADITVSVFGALLGMRLAEIITKKKERANDA